MSSCTSRKDDWTRFGKAIRTFLGTPWYVITGKVTVRWPTGVVDRVRSVYPWHKRIKWIWTDFHQVLHTGKNIIVEELRRWGFEVRGKRCDGKS